MRDKTLDARYLRLLKEALKLGVGDKKWLKDVLRREKKRLRGG